MCRKISIILILHFLLLINFKYEDVTVSNKTDPYLLLVNKENSLKSDYVPDNLIIISDISYIIRNDETMMLDNEVYLHFLLMYHDALSKGLELTIFSAYRSYQKQESLWNKNPNIYLVAKPGFSEHQTGLAIDISRKDVGLTNHFMDTNEYKYLINNAHKYGFIIRYPKNKQHITGYVFEPWHIRYVGIKHSTIIYKKKLTLEEYLS